jgi:hypothetical protein
MGQNGGKHFSQEKMVGNQSEGKMYKLDVAALLGWEFDGCCLNKFH